MHFKKLIYIYLFLFIHLYKTIYYRWLILNHIISYHKHICKAP